MNRDNIGLGIFKINGLGTRIRIEPSHSFNVLEDVRASGFLYVVHEGTVQPAIFELLQLMSVCDIQANWFGEERDEGLNGRNDDRNDVKIDDRNDVRIDVRNDVRDIVGIDDRNDVRNDDRIQNKKINGINSRFWCKATGKSSKLMVINLDVEWNAIFDGK